MCVDPINKRPSVFSQSQKYEGKKKRPFYPRVYGTWVSLTPKYNVS